MNDRRLEVPIDLVPLVGATGCVPDRTGEPVTVGIPCPRGVIVDPCELSLRPSADRATVPLQAAVLDRWADGSIRWVLLDFQADTEQGALNTYVLAADGANCKSSTAVSTTTDADAVQINTGAATFLVRPGGAFAFDQVTIGTGDCLDSGRSGLTVVDRSGRTWPGVIGRVAIETDGPLRTVVRCDGEIGTGRDRRLVFTARLHFYAGSATARVVLTLLNPRAARHRDNYWELGDPASILLEDASVVLGVPQGSARESWCSLEPGAPLCPVAQPVEIYQDSSGGERWQSRAHLNREGRVPNSFRGYRARFGDRVAMGLRAAPVVSLRAEDRDVSVAVPQFCQYFQKAIETTGYAVVLRLWPRQ
jgi:hypothetical protein